MKIKRLSPITNTVNEAEINITQEQLDRWHNGEVIQRAAPHLTPDEREFLITGILPDEWNKIFKQ